MTETMSGLTKYGCTAHFTRLKAKWKQSLTLVSMLLVHALAFDNSTLISLLVAFLMFVRDLSSEFSVDALLGHDCLRRPDDDLFSFYKCKLIIRMIKC